MQSIRCIASNNVPMDFFTSQNGDLKRLFDTVFRALKIDFNPDQFFGSQKELESTAEGTIDLVEG